MRIIRWCEGAAGAQAVLGNDPLPGRRLRLAPLPGQRWRYAAQLSAVAAVTRPVGQPDGNWSILVSRRR